MTFFVPFFRVPGTSSPPTLSHGSSLSPSCLVDAPEEHHCPACEIVSFSSQPTQTITYICPVAHPGLVRPPRPAPVPPLPSPPTLRHSSHERQPCWLAPPRAPCDTPQTPRPSASATPSPDPSPPAAHPLPIPSVTRRPPLSGHSITGRSLCFGAEDCAPRRRSFRTDCQRTS